MDKEVTFRPMRRFKQALPQEECFRILENAYRGFLSVIGDGGYPYTVPVKEPGDWWYYVKSVICFGRVSILSDDSGRQERFRSLGRKYFPDTYDTDKDILMNGPRAEILEFTIEHVSGKSVREK
jgi:nitroimidazol reductase NimA-like FMN-containing flavoprotein (pyridoxamine 5'-phosphate oxidase superfamily)